MFEFLTLAFVPFWLFCLGAALFDFAADLAYNAITKEEV